MSRFCAPLRAVAGRFGPFRCFPLGARLSGVALLLGVLERLVRAVVVEVLVRVAAALLSTGSSRARTGSSGASTGSSGANAGNSGASTGIAKYG